MENTTFKIGDTIVLTRNLDYTLTLVQRQFDKLKNVQKRKYKILNIFFDDTFNCQRMEIATPKDKHSVAHIGYYEDMVAMHELLTSKKK